MNGFISFSTAPQRLLQIANQRSGSFRARAVQDDFGARAGFKQARFSVSSQSWELPRFRRSRRWSAVIRLLVIAVICIDAAYTGVLSAAIGAGALVLKGLSAYASELFVAWGVGLVWTILTVIRSSKNEERIEE